MQKFGKIIVVGGVAGGASAAARARRLCEDCEIIIYDKGPFVSFANCGLPYYVGNVIKNEEKLIVASPELFKNRFNIDARTEHEVISIDRANKTIEVRDLRQNKVRRESYTALVLSPGAMAVTPPIPGIDLPGIFSLRTIPDSQQILSWIKTHQVKSVVIVGGGFIGLEMAENLGRLGLNISIIDLADQVMPPLDPEMAVPVENRLKLNHVQLHLGDAVTAFSRTAEDKLKLVTKSSKELLAEMVILSIGVRPSVALAVSAGLALGKTGGIAVNEHMQTSDPAIWAVGDAVEVKDYVTGSEVLIPLAGPANRQGRIAAENIFGRTTRFRGTQGTAICEVFDLTIAMTGASEKSLRKNGSIPYEKIYLHPGSHVGYFPGAKPIHLKLLFNPVTGTVLGAQAVGEEGVARRIDIIAMLIQKNGTVFDLEEAELCYAPQFGAAKDPVNMAGMIAANVVQGDLPISHTVLDVDADSLLVDVREPAEFQSGAIPGAINIPLGELRSRIGEVTGKKQVMVYCGVGQRAYYATRLLRLHNIDVKNLPGGILTWNMRRQCAH